MARSKQGAVGTGEQPCRMRVCQRVWVVRLQRRSPSRWWRYLVQALERGSGEDNSNGRGAQEDSCRLASGSSEIRCTLNSLRYVDRRTMDVQIRFGTIVILPWIRKGTNGGDVLPRQMLRGKCLGQSSKAVFQTIGSSWVMSEKALYYMISTKRETKLMRCFRLVYLDKCRDNYIHAT